MKSERWKVVQRSYDYRLFGIVFAGKLQIAAVAATAAASVTVAVVGNSTVMMAVCQSSCWWETYMWFGGVDVCGSSSDNSKNNRKGE